MDKSLKEQVDLTLGESGSLRIENALTTCEETIEQLPNESPNRNTYISVYIKIYIEDKPALNLPALLKIWQDSFKSAFLFTNLYFYNTIIEGYANLLYVTDCPKLLQFFCDGLYENHSISPHACADVIMLYICLKHLNGHCSADQLRTTLIYWIKCNNSYAQHSQNPTQFHVQRLIKFVDGFVECELPRLSTGVYRFLRCVAPLSDHGLELQSWELQLHGLLKTPFSGVDQYYKLLELMEMLGSCSQTDWLLPSLRKVKELMQGSKCQLLSDAYFKYALTAKTCTQMSILSELLPLADKGSWHLQQLLHVCKNNNYSELSKLAAAHLTVDKTLLSLLEILNIRTTPNSDENIEDFGSKTNLKFTFRHVCAPRSLKRKRSSNDAKLLLDQLQSTVQQLGKCAVELDAADLRKLEHLIQRLQNSLPA